MAHAAGGDIGHAALRPAGGGRVGAGCRRLPNAAGHVGAAAGDEEESGMSEDKWTLSVLIGLPIVGFIALAFLAAIALGVWAFRDGDDDGATLVVGGVIGGVILLAATGYSYYPYRAEYHRWKPVAGEVDQVQSQPVSTWDGNQKFVIRLKNNRLEYGCEDTRCSLLKPGERLELSCVQVWMYSGADGFDCNYVRSEAK
jgi:hypothetical protein